MRISVVGATGRVGAKLTRNLLKAGHQVRALSRGGPALGALVELGAEPFLGSFDTGEGDLDQFFRGRCRVPDGEDRLEQHRGHYPAVAKRFVDALEKSSVKLAVNLTAMGSDVKGKTGHFECFHDLDEKLNELGNIDLVHLRAAWFMDDVSAWTGPVAKYGRIAWFCKPDLKMPWVATDDIAWLAAKELTNPRGRHRVYLEVGSEDVSMNELAETIGKKIGRPVDYRYIETTRKDVEAEFLARFGTLEKWQDDTLSADALNSGIVRFHGEHEYRPKLPTTMETFIGDVWKTRYLDAVKAGEQRETFFMWAARD